MPLFILRKKIAAQHRMKPQQGEKAGGDLKCAELFRITTSGHRSRPPGIRGDNLKRVRLRLDVAQVGSGLPHHHFRPLGIHRKDIHQARGVPDRQGTQQHRVDDAEDGGRGADAQRQSQHGHCSEAGRFAQASQTVAYVLDYAFKKWKTPVPAALFQLPGGVTQLPLRRVACFFRVHAGDDVFLRL